MSPTPLPAARQHSGSGMSLITPYRDALHRLAIMEAALSRTNAALAMVPKHRANPDEAAVEDTLRAAVEAMQRRIEALEAECEALDEGGGA